MAINKPGRKPKQKLKCKYCGEFEDREKVVKVGSVNVCKIHRQVYLDAEHDKKFKKDLAKGLRLQKKKEIDRKKQRKEALYQLESISSIESKVQDVFNKMRRFEELLWFKKRNLEPTCISCGLPLRGDQWACGHYKAAGSGQFHMLRFDRMNTYLQHNVRCNKALSGDIVNYELGIIKRFGPAEGQVILDYCNTHKPDINWTREELAAMKKDFAKRARELEKQLSE